MTKKCSADETLCGNAARVPVAERIKSALSLLRDCRLGPFDLILEILDE